MKKLLNIKAYPVNLQLKYELDGEIEIENLYFDGLAGELSEQDWRDDNEIVSSYNEEDQNKILRALEATANIDFFTEENQI